MPILQMAVWAALACAGASAAGESSAAGERTDTPRIVEEGITPPVRSSYVQPEYPEVARTVRIESQVILKAVVQRDGRTSVYEVLKSTRPGFGFEQAATRAVEQWRYEPARLAGEPVAVYLTVNVDFSLDSERPAKGAKGNVLVLRATSVDTAQNEARLVWSLLGMSSADDPGWLLPLLPSVDFSQLTSLERSRPWYLILPAAGAADGMWGLVVALPLQDDAPTHEVVEQLARASGGELIDPGVPGDGVYVLKYAPGSILARVADDYLVVAYQGPLALDLDLPTLVGRTDSLQGSVTVDLDLDLPLWAEWLADGRRILKRKIAKGEEEPFVDLLLDLAKDLLANTSRLELALETGSRDFHITARLTPRAGSTLEGLARAQPQEAPHLMRYVEQKDSAVLIASKLRATPALIEATSGYVRRLAELTGGDESMTSWIEEVLPEALESAQAWWDCHDDESATAFSLDGDGEMQVVEVVRTDHVAACTSLWSILGSDLEGLPQGPEGETLSVQRNGYQYGDVTATRQTVSFVSPDASPEDRMLDSPAISYFGSSGKLFLALTGGADADRKFRALIDRTVTAQDPPTSAAAPFAPLRLGPGVFLRLDPRGPGAASQVPGSGDRQPAADSRVLFGIRFDEYGLNLELVTPLAVIERLGPRTPPPTPGSGP